MNLPARTSTKIITSGMVANQHADATKTARYTVTLTSNTQRRMKADLNVFFRYLRAAQYEYQIADFHQLLADGQTERAWFLWSGVTYGHVEAFIEWMKQEGYRIGSINIRLSTVKTYCRLALAAHVIDQEDESQIARIASIRHKAGITIDKHREKTSVGLKKKEPTIISSAHAALLKRQKRAKDAVMICILLDLGFRCSELAQLKISDISLREGLITVYREKVDMTQKHRLTPDCLQALMAYLPTVNGEWLLPGHSGRHISTNGINKRIGELGLAIGIENLSPHDLRHHLITEEAAKGTDSNTLRQIGGWSSPAMALKYMNASDIANSGASFFRQ